MQRVGMSDGHRRRGMESEQIAKQASIMIARGERVGEYTGCPHYNVISGYTSCPQYNVISGDGT